MEIYLLVEKKFKQGIWVLYFNIFMKTVENISQYFKSHFYLSQIYPRDLIQDDRKLWLHSLCVSCCCVTRFPCTVLIHMLIAAEALHDLLPKGSSRGRGGERRHAAKVCCAGMFHGKYLCGELLFFPLWPFPYCLSLDPSCSCCSWKRKYNWARCICLQSQDSEWSFGHREWSWPLMKFAHAKLV